MTSATTDRRLGLVGGTAIKAPVACATTANITLSGEQTIDGVTTSTSRVLVKNQTNGVQNGIYLSSSAAWTRDIDCNGNLDVVTGTLVGVTGGTTQARSFWQITTAGTITIDTTSITWSISLTTQAVSAFIATLLDDVDAATARATLSAAASGPNPDITSLSGLTGAVSGPTSIAGAAAGMTITNVTSINSGPLYGSRAINGACEIDQVNAAAATTPTVGTGYVIDQWKYTVGASSKLTFQQVADAPAGLKNSIKVLVAAQYSPGVAEQFILWQPIEGNNVIDFKLGTAGAAVITLSNQIKGSIAGTYAGFVRNSAANRSYAATIAVTTSWAPVQITLTGDTTGTWLTDTGIGLAWGIDLGSGTNFNTTAGAWQAGSFSRTSGAVTFVNQVNGSTLNITGLDVRLGSTAPTVFERRLNELQLCQKRWESCFSQGTAPANSVAVGRMKLHNMSAAPVDTGINVVFKVSKAVVPTMTAYNSSGSTSSALFDNPSTEGVQMYVAGLGAGGLDYHHWVADSRL